MITALADGTVRLSDGPLATVQYLVFELAECDVRSYLSFAERLETAWTLRTLHQLAVGLEQLHRIQIAHQDLKPSNVLLFDRALAKIADLGCASLKGAAGPRDQLMCAGDRTYAPPELLYGGGVSDWTTRRFGCDAYLLGSMAVFFFTGLSMTAIVQSRLPEAQRWFNWSGSFEEVLPYLTHAHHEVNQQIKKEMPSSISGELTRIVEQLCEPNPDLRGHPLGRRPHGNKYSLERYVSWFNLLARKAELSLL